MTPEILFALVSNGASGVKMGFFASCMQAFRNRNIEMAWIGDGDIRRARNAAATYLLTETQIPWLLFIDMDIVFTPEHVEMLFESEEPIVGGVYYLKNRLNQACAVRLKDHEYPENAPMGRSEVARIGTGFMRIHRSVFEELAGLSESYLNLPERSNTHRTSEMYTTHDGKKQYDFFPMYVKDDELLTEDWGFCDFAREAGFKIWLDTRIVLGHEGTAVYPLAK